MLAPLKASPCSCGLDLAEGNSARRSRKTALTTAGLELGISWVPLRWSISLSLVLEACFKHDSTSFQEAQRKPKVSCTTKFAFFYVFCWPKTLSHNFCTLHWLRTRMLLFWQHDCSKSWNSFRRFASSTSCFCWDSLFFSASSFSAIRDRRRAISLLHISKIVKLQLINQNDELDCLSAASKSRVQNFLWQVDRNFTVTLSGSHRHLDHSVGMESIKA